MRYRAMLSTLGRTNAIRFDDSSGPHIVQLNTDRHLCKSEVMAYRDGVLQVRVSCQPLGPYLSVGQPVP
jgi:hypothetical protein